jgi:NADH-quinone oxidoreductase subunit D
MGQVGDVWDRFIMKVREMEQSIKIIEQALADLPDGNVQSAIPRRILPTKSEIYVRTESPRGELGFYVIADGTGSPYRVKARGPAFVNLSVVPEISKGCMLGDLVAIIGSADIVLGEVDR